MRQQQLSQLKKANELPYTPIQFSYSETIGSKKTDSKSTSIYSHEYRDILTPRVLNHHNPLFYLLFHTPTIYNWIRTIKTNESRLLDTYIRTNNGLLNNVSKQNQINLTFLKSSLADYVKKWQVVKLSYSHKVYVKRQISEGEICTHFCKTQVYVHEIQYLPKFKSFVYPRIYCRQCQQAYQFQCQTRQFSHYLIINNPTQANITLSLQKITYNLYLAMNEQLVYVKCANKVWYQINPLQKTVKPIGLPQINLRIMKLAAYSQLIKESSVLKIAQPLLDLTEEKKMEQKQQMDLQVEEKPVFLQKQNNKQTKPQQSSKPKKQLKELKANPNKVVLKQKSQEYIDSVSKLYIEPKVKDEYELGYDKGKLKKKKQKREYIKPDFNQIFKQIKVNGPPINEPAKEGKKIKKKSNKNKALNFGDDKQQ